jgi:polyisoprenoid-binding protein YceI
MIDSDTNHLKLHLALHIHFNKQKLLHMKLLKLFISFLFFVNTSFAQVYTPTDAGSSVHFTIKNFGIKVGGDFTGLKGSITFNPKALATSSMSVSVDANTINTDNGSRDKHLRKEEYFDVAKYTTLSFVSTKITESSVAGRFFVVGNLTIKGVTKSVQFGFSAIATDVGYKFTGEFEINRRDYGVGGSSSIMADKLKIKLDIAAKK